MELGDRRGDFPALSRQIDGQPITYLDSAATTLKPRTVIDAISHFYETNGANIHRGKHYLSEEASDAFEGVRTRVAQFVGAFGNEIVFVRNTSEALNLVASGLSLEPTDVVVGCLDAHHSNILPWRRFADLRLARLGADGRIDQDHFRELLALHPKVVTLTHCSNVTGAVAPIEDMARAAKAACGAIVVVDGAQSLPHLRFDVSTSEIDFLAFSAHKMLGPTGVGCLFGRRAALERLRPLHLGGGMVDWVDDKGSRDRKIPHRFEAGTPATASVIAFAAALEYLENLDEGALRTHDRALTEALLSHVAAREELTLLGPGQAADRAPIATFRIANCRDLADVARALSDSYGIMCRSGHMCAQPLVNALGTGDVLRASAYVYNSVAEIEALFAGLDEVVALLAR